MTLQEILAHALDDDAILNDWHIVNFTNDSNKVNEHNVNKVMSRLGDGQKSQGVILVGADDICSKVRKLLLGQIEASYSEYICYTRIVDFVPPILTQFRYHVFFDQKEYYRM